MLPTQVGMQHHPQRGRHQRYRAWPMRPHCFGPTVELESLQQHERSRLGYTLQYPEHPADMHERRVDDRDTAPQLRRRRRSLILRAHHAVRQHVVGEVHAFGRSGRSAGQHPHRNAGPPVWVGAGLAGRNHFRLDVLARNRHHGGGRRPAQHRQVVRLADDQRQVQLVDVCLGALIAAGRIDHHHRRSALQHAKQSGHLGRAVTQQDSDLRVLVGTSHQRTDPVGHSAKLAPRHPLALVLQSGCVRLQTQNIGDAPTKRVRRHRILGSDVGPRPRAASSAVPIGFPSRV